MLHALLADARFWQFLQRLDEDLAATARAARCPHCGGALHRGDYPRKPRGVDRGLLIGGGAQTLARWRRWWRETLPATAFWQAVRDRFLPPLAPDELPQSLLERFTAAGSTIERLAHALHFLAPLSAPGVPVR